MYNIKLEELAQSGRSRRDEEKTLLDPHRAMYFDTGAAFHGFQMGGSTF
jgi:hypothetical protein